MENETKIPRHIAIIMDGNGRWAKKRFMPRLVGHKSGVEALRKVVEHSARLKVEALTVYAFSTENWKRSAEEVEGLMKLLVTYLTSELEKLVKNDIKLICSGDITALPEKPREILLSSIDKTKDSKGMVLNLALNYGGRDEIVRAVKKISSSVKNGSLEIEDIDETTISNCLYTKDIPDPDLVIRTSGEIRLSNFLLWQVAYSEFYYTDILWPDFNEKELDKAIDEYNRRNRRFGKA